MQKVKFELYILVYSIVFLAIRLLPSTIAMTYDEAEQFIDAEHFYLGYSDQPPLYSWLTKLVSLVAGLNVPAMVILYHLIVTLFLLFLYWSIKKVWREEFAQIVFLSNALFFIYSYDFYRYTIHTALVMLFAVLALFVYLKIYEKASLINYLSLGLVCAGGLLSKYNFVFCISVLIFGSLFTQRGREIVLSPKSLLTILACFLLFYPHLNWLWANDFSSINYVLYRSQGIDGGFSMLQVLLDTYWNLALYTLVFFLFFKKDFHFDHLASNQLFKNFKMIALVAILVPLVSIIALKAGYFTQRWLAPINIFLPLALFSFVEFKLQTKRYKLFIVLVAMIILSCAAARLLSYYLPDKFGPGFMHKPYASIYGNLNSQLYKTGMGSQIEELQFISFKEVGILAGIKTFYPQAKVLVYRNNKEIKLQENMIIVWDDDRNSEFERQMQKRAWQVELLFSRSAPYTYAKNLDFYKVNFAKLLLE